MFLLEAMWTMSLLPDFLCQKNERSEHVSERDIAQKHYSKSALQDPSTTRVLVVSCVVLVNRIAYGSRAFGDAAHERNQKCIVEVAKKILLKPARTSPRASSSALHAHGPKWCTCALLGSVPTLENQALEVDCTKT